MDIPPEGKFLKKGWSSRDDQRWHRPSFRRIQKESIRDYLVYRNPEEETAMSETKKKSKSIKHRNRIRIDQKSFGRLMATKRRLLRKEKQRGQSQAQTELPA